MPTIALSLLLSCGSHLPVDPASPSQPQASTTPSQGLEADLGRARAFSASRPEYERPLDDGLKLPPGLLGVSVADCAPCHAEIAAEWELTTHARAWTDVQFQKEIQKSDNRWLCLNCHTPLRTQQDVWPVALTGEDVEAPVLVDNPAYNAALRGEGITCAACHLRDGQIHGPGISDPANPPPHGFVADPDFTNQGICLRCHQATANYPGKSFVCTFRTGEEWRAGPYDDAGKGCSTCHMPEVQRSVTPGFPVRTTRMHHWRGAGIAKDGDPHPPASSNPPGLGVTAAWGGGSLRLDLANANAGHMLPTGDPERWVQVDVDFLDAGGGEVGEPWTRRFGQTWEWWPEPKKLGDTRLLPQEVRSYEIPAPAGAVKAVVSASSHRISEETANYHHLGDYPRSLDTHRLEVTPDGVTGGVIAP